MPRKKTKHSRSRLSFKFLGAFLLAGILTYLFAAFGTSAITSRYLIQREKVRLYNHVQDIEDDYRANPSMPESELFYRVQAYAHGMDCSIWILNSSGYITLKSEWESIRGSVETPFQPTDFDRDNSMIGTFYDLLDEPSISVYVPLASNFRTVGYIVVHEPLSALDDSINQTVNMTFLTSVLTFALFAAIMLVLMHFSINKPMRAITSAVQEYSRGNLSYHAEVHSHDEFRILSDALNDMSSRLARTEEDQQKFISNVSHDFRSPLTSIKGYLEAILDGTIPSELAPKYLNIVLNETGRLTKLTQNMLALNTIQAGGKIMDYSDFDINEEVRKVLASLEGSCRERNITLDFVHSGDSLSVHADLPRIQQVLYNLVDNAIKFSNPEGTVTVETSRRHDLAFISVKDRGCGISKENVSKIWDRFYKTDASRGRDKKGTGLGLSIVKEILDAHGSVIDCISTEGVGTEFVFRLNLSEDEKERDDV